MTRLAGRLCFLMALCVVVSACFPGSDGENNNTNLPNSVRTDAGDIQTPGDGDAGWPVMDGGDHGDGDAGSPDSGMVVPPDGGDHDGDGDAGSSVVDDGGVAPEDAGHTVHDAGDSGPLDGGTAPNLSDAGGIDAGQDGPDAGVDGGLSFVDAGTMDAGPTDAGGTFLDSDNDGLSDSMEVAAGSDPGDPCSPALDAGACDRDGDGLTNEEEAVIGADENNPCIPLADVSACDQDSDGLTNEEEVLAGSLPTVSDTDGDGVLDGADADPTRACVPDPFAGACDEDADGLTYDEEVQMGSDPANPCDPSFTASTCDADGDGLTHEEEALVGTDPDDPCDPFLSAGTCDVDNDGLTNDEETALGLDLGNPDTDGDAVLDGEDSEPLNACVPDLQAGACDADADGLTNDEELLASTDPAIDDTDADGVLDGNDAQPTNPCIPSLEGGLCDADEDGLTTDDETALGSDPSDACSPNMSVNACDADSDGFTNGEEASFGGDPNDPCDPLLSAGACDQDFDGLTNDEEAALGADATDACSPSVQSPPCDQDNDGLTNAEEVALGTYPAIADSDADGLIDSADGVPLDPCFPNQAVSACPQPPDGGDVDAGVIPIPMLDGGTPPSIDGGTPPLLVERVRALDCDPAAVGAEMTVAEVSGSTGARVVIRPFGDECAFHLLHRSTEGVYTSLSSSPSGYLIVSAQRFSPDAALICASNVLLTQVSGARYEASSVGVECWADRGAGFGPKHVVVVQDTERAAWVHAVEAEDLGAGIFSLTYAHDFSFQFMNMADNGRPSEDGMYKVTLDIPNASTINVQDVTKISDTSIIVKETPDENGWEPTPEDLERYPFMDGDDGPCADGCLPPDSGVTVTTFDLSGASPRDCAHQLALDPLSPSGLYYINPDQTERLLAYCDMETDDGGWTLVMNYTRTAGNEESIVARDDALPHLGGELGTNNYEMQYWGHASAALLSRFDFTEVRLFAQGTASGGRTIHFKTSLPSVITYYRTGDGSMSGVQHNHTLLSGHLSSIPTGAQTFSGIHPPPAPDEAMPAIWGKGYSGNDKFWYANTRGDGYCIDGTLSACGFGYDTVHRVYIRSVDTDGDGVIDPDDAFPQDANEQYDGDSDGYGDNSDPCPVDPLNACVIQGTSCRAILEEDGSAPDGLYWIDLIGEGARQYYCDMEDGGWLVLFNSDDVTHWNSDVGTPGAGNWAHSVIPPMNEVRLTRMDYGWSVAVEGIDESQLLGCSMGSNGLYWNGTLNNIHNALHLGVANGTAQGQLSTYVLVGNPCIINTQSWGFGHRGWVDDQQGYGWDSADLGPTVFRISVRLAHTQ